MLNTLPKRELIAGMAEVIKYGIIADKIFFAYLENNISSILKLEPNYLIHIVEVSCKIKAQIVEKDERESGLRAILNYGHTIGHALESVTNYKIFKHGEAVSIGMAYAAQIAYKLNLCNQNIVNQQCALIKSIGLPITFDNISVEEIINALSLDKKVQYGKLRFILTGEIGSAIIFDNVTDCILRNVLADKK